MYFHFCCSAAMLRFLIHLFVTVIILDGVYVASQSTKGCSVNTYSCSTQDYSVRYPFWMKDDAADNGYICGYPGFSISCGDESHGGRPVINISNHLYYVQSIDYERQRFRIVDVDIDGSECPRPRHNISVDSITTPFLQSDYRTMIYYNCSKYPPQNATDYYYRLPCLDQVDANRRSFQLKLYYYEDGAVNWNGNCEQTVEIPYYYGSWNTNYTQSLKFGFYLHWDRSDRCEDSGGMSVFNYTTSAFHCLCNVDHYPYDVVFESVCPHKGMPIRLKIITGVCTGLGASLLILILLLCYRRIWFSTCGLVRNQSNVEVFLENCGHLPTERYKYSDIKKMTDSFKEKLGQGGYATLNSGSGLNATFNGVSSNRYIQ